MLLILFFSGLAWSQDLLPEKMQLTFKDGITFRQENDFMMRMRFRVQTRFTAVTEDADDTNLETSEFTVRRTRLRFDGFAHNPNFLYRLQLSFTRGDQDWDNSQVPNILRDAVAGWRWHPMHTLWFGLAKLPGNRQRTISSSAQQFVDRSSVNATFNVDRDAGLQQISQFGTERPVWLKLALSNGEGRNQPNKNASLATTARLEWYPLGSFHDDGDNFEADLFREPEPRLGLGVATSANQKTSRTAGQLGKNLPDDEFRSMETRFVDVVYKHSGYSLSAEYAKRTAGSPVVTNDLYLFEGEGFNIQSGYLFENNWEPSLRYSSIWTAPEIRKLTQDNRQYTAGLSHYIQKHVVKIQSDLTYQEKAAQHQLAYESNWTLRVQLEFGI